MKHFTKAALLFAIFLLLATGSAHAAQVAVGVTIGAPPPPRVVRVTPARPGPDFVWVGGYWYPVSGHYLWHAGYWTRPPYVGAHWIEPRHDGRQFYAGYWDGPRGRIEHDHRWDHGHNRDFDHRP